VKDEDICSAWRKNEHKSFGWQKFVFFEGGRDESRKMLENFRGFSIKHRNILRSRDCGKGRKICDSLS
jgi:hypothetical protein